MKRRGAALIWLLALMCASCEFEPVYRQQSEHLDVRESLAHVSIETPNSREGDQLKAYLEDGFRQSQSPTQPSYVLRLDIQSEQRPFIINLDGISARYDIILTSNYQLLRLSDAFVLDSGQIRRQVSYNVSDTNDYATYISQKDAKKRGIKAISEDYQQQIAAKLSRAIGAK